MASQNETLATRRWSARQLPSLRRLLARWLRKDAYRDLSPDVVAGDIELQTETEIDGAPQPQQPLAAFAPPASNLAGSQPLAARERDASLGQPVAEPSLRSILTRSGWAAALLFSLVFVTRVLLLGAAREAAASTPESLWPELAGDLHVAAVAPPNVCQLDDASSAAEASFGGTRGALRIESMPPAHVFVDGSRIGSTPQLTTGLSPGPHTVELVHPQNRLRKAMVVDIDPGQLTTRVVDLTQ
jgi:hypothetical protein